MKRKRRKKQSKLNREREQEEAKLKKSECAQVGPKKVNDGVCVFHATTE